MTYPMDEETKEYIDGKFARIGHQKTQEDNEAVAKNSVRRTRVQRIIAVCATILVILALSEFGLLYWAQLRGS